MFWQPVPVRLWTGKMKYKMSQFSRRLRKYKHSENIRNHKMHEKLMQCYKVLTLEFLCKDGTTFSLWLQEKIQLLLHRLTNYRKKMARNPKSDWQSIQVFSAGVWIYDCLTFVSDVLCAYVIVRTWYDMNDL